MTLKLLSSRSLKYHHSRAPTKSEGELTGDALHRRHAVGAGTGTVSSTGGQCDTRADSLRQVAALLTSQYMAPHPFPPSSPPPDLMQNRVGLYLQRQGISLRRRKLKVVPLEQQRTSKSSKGISWKIDVESHENFYLSWHRNLG